MIAEKATTARQIIVTTADFDRLHELVDSPKYRATHATLLAALKEELARCKVVEQGGVPKGVITMHSRVRVRDKEEDEPQTFTLVYPKDADIMEEKLSVLTPLGTALLGMKAGQVVTFDAPGGARKLKVERVLYQPEAAGDLHL